MNQTRLDEISQLVQSSRDLKSFYESFLSTVAQMSNARVGVAWNCTQQPYRPICQIQSKMAEPMRLAISENKHLELLNRAAQNNRAIMVKPREDQHGATNDQPVLMFGPIRRDSQIELVEFIIPNDQSQEANKQVLRELDQMCALASHFEERAVFEEPIEEEPIEGDTGDSQTTRGFASLSRDAVDQYAHIVHGSLDYKETAQTIANEARRVLDCDRVNVALKKGSIFKLIAISGQPSVNRRSNTVQMLGRLTTRALATGQAFWYPDDNQLPPQLEKPLNEYLGFSATRSMAILPIYDQPIRENLDPNATPPTPKIVAGLIIEHCNEQWNRQRVAPSIEIVSRHAADAMRNALGHRQLFLYPLWRLLGQSKVVTAARNLPKSLSIAGGLLLLALALTFIPAPFTLHSDGVLLPQTRRKVYSEIDGQVIEIDVQHGQTVLPGDTLLHMTNEDLQFQIEQINGEIAALQERLKANQTLRIAKRDPENQQLVQDNTQAIKSEIESLQKRQATLRSKSRKLTVVSPIGGEVITWNVADRLRNRPVKTGDLLLEVADVEGQWELELDLPDRRIGHLLRELRRRKEAGDESGIAVTYHLAADPSSRFSGRIKSVARATQLTSDQKQGVRVVVEIDASDIETIRQARSGVSAKIHCGYEPLGYVWLHDLFEFVQSKILFRIW